MFFCKRPTGARFKIFLKIERGNFILKSEVSSELYWQAFYGSGHVSFLMTSEAFTQIGGTTNIGSVFTFKQVNVKHIR